MGALELGSEMLITEFVVTSTTLIVDPVIA
jgi:hypothetical protein